METPASDTGCPLPDEGGQSHVSLALGEGGRLMRRWIADQILPRFSGGRHGPPADAARLLLPGDSDSDGMNFGNLDAGALAMTTDSFVVSPLFFPGGDIGKLAIYGTANDLAVAGARPRWISLALIIEEGLPMETLQRVLTSVADAAAHVGAEVVTGDTKVVPRGAADGLFLNTTGVGVLVEAVPPGPSALQTGDVLIVSGPIGRHGIAVMCAREELGFTPPPTSDCAPLFGAVEALRRAEVPVRAMRDATRGGLAAVLHEWAADCGQTLWIEESALPVSDDVRGACELLGLDPIHIANEGTMVVAIPRESADTAIAALRTVPVSAGAALIGEVTQRTVAPVVVERGLGRLLPLDEPAGAPLPRIC